jgi:anaerobic magnesium-protoporphyrin IX monomethyl ester cyclase
LKKKKLVVALVRGPIVYGDGAINNEATPAIGFAYLAGYLRQYGYDPVIVDGIGEGLNQTWPLERYPGYNCHGLTFAEIVERIPSDSDVIGFSGMFSGEWPVMRDLITEVRKHFPKAFLVAGGEHVSSLTEYSLRDCPALDVCVRGEGERTFYQLLEHYAECGEVADIHGVGYLDNSGVFCMPLRTELRKGESGTDPARIRDIDEIPWPYWPEGYMEKFWAAEKSYGVSTERDMPFQFSRGCPYECTFCSNPLMWGNAYRLRDVEDVMKEIYYYVDRYDITAIQLYDLTAITKKSWIVDFCKQLIASGLKLKLSLPSGTRSEALDNEVLELLKKAGCNYLVYAPESGSPRTLQLIKKAIKLDKLTDSVMEAKRQGIAVRTNLIIGFPGETWGDVFKTLLYGLKMAVKGVDDIPIFVFSPYPGTEIFHQLQQQGVLNLNDQYLLKLQTMNSNYLSTKVMTFNPHTRARLLGVVRMVFILANYIVGYLFHPSRILRTIRSVLTGKGTATVLEHRLKDLLRRNIRKDPVV